MHDASHAIDLSSFHRWRACTTTRARLFTLLITSRLFVLRPLSLTHFYTDETLEMPSKSPRLHLLAEIANATTLENVVVAATVVVVAVSAAAH